MSRSFDKFFNSTPDYRDFDEVAEFSFQTSLYPSTRRYLLAKYQDTHPRLSRSVDHAAARPSSPPSHRQTPGLNSPLAVSHSSSRILSHHEVPCRVVPVSAVTSRDLISSTPVGENSRRIGSNLYSNTTTGAPQFGRQTHTTSAAAPSHLQSHASIFPIHNAEMPKTAYNSQSEEERQLQLKADADAQWYEHQALKLKMHAVKIRYNAGNARLRVISEQLMVPGFSEEACVMLTKEYNMITAQCLKYQKEFSEMQRQIDETSALASVNPELNLEQTPYNIPRDLLPIHEAVDDRPASETFVQDLTTNSRSRLYGFRSGKTTQFPAVGFVPIAKQENAKVSPFEASFGCPAFSFSTKDLIATRSVSSENLSSNGQSVEPPEIQEFVSSAADELESTGVQQLLVTDQPCTSKRSNGINESFSSKAIEVEDGVIKPVSATGKVVDEENEGDIATATKARTPLANLFATIESVPNTPVITAAYTGPGVLDLVENIEALDVSNSAEESTAEDALSAHSALGSEDEWEKL